MKTSERGWACAANQLILRANVFELNKEAALVFMQKNCPLPMVC